MAIREFFLGRHAGALAVGVGLVAVSPAALAATAWNLADEFSLNPTGSSAWHYGFAERDGAVQQFSASGISRGLETWQAVAPALDKFSFPIIGKNATAESLQPGTAIFLPGEVVAHPGVNGEYAVVSWVAPQATQLSLTVAFEGRDPGGTSTDVHVSHNDVGLFSTTVNGFASPVGFSYMFYVQAGDVITFAVGDGGNGNARDWTQVSASLTAMEARLFSTPLPGSLLLLLSALAGMPMLGRRRQKDEMLAEHRVS